MTFFCKLLSPRPDFAETMTAEEMAVMQQHVAYWRQGITDGHVLMFGPVADPRGAYGVGIVNFDSAEAARSWSDADPVIQSGLGFVIEIAPMPRGVVTA